MPYIADFGASKMISIHMKGQQKGIQEGDSSAISVAPKTYDTVCMYICLRSCPRPNFIFVNPNSA